MDKPLIDRLAERVERLERENHCLRWGGTFALFAGLVIILGGARRADDHKLEVRELVVQDEAGASRIVLGVRDNGPYLNFITKEGTARLHLGLQRITSAWHTI